MKRSKSEVPKPAVRILKEGSCPSLSGKPSLTYHVGRTAETEIYFRIAANTGGGFFSDEWVAFSAIQEVFEQQSKGKPIVSHILYPLFNGRSLNTPAFLLAVLKAEGLVRPLGDKQRGYERIDPAEFLAKVEKLMKSAVNFKEEEGKQSPESTPQPAKRDKKSGKSTPESTTASAS